MNFDLSARLSELRNDYTEQVNLLLEEGRDDLAAEVASRYPDDAARLICAGSLVA